MPSVEQINEIHRLASDPHWSMRRIARHLHLTARTVKKYLENPAPTPVHRPRPSLLDPFKPLMAELLDQDPLAPGTVILDRLRATGYSGGHTILREYLSHVRPPRSAPRAFVRMEPAAGERFEIDWGHFGTLNYQGDFRKLYAFCLIEAHSRMLFVEFTHSQSFETFLRCHQHAFTGLGGVARECWYDNLLTVVAEHDGRLVRFNPRFLAFAREYRFSPRACNPGAAWEKGKIEASIAYLRSSFWPLRSFTDLADVNHQVRQWLQEVANCRLHRETRQRPSDRFRPDALRPLPALAPDYRDTAEVFIYKDLRWYFDGNRYGAPARFVGQRLIAKADASSVTLYDPQGTEIVRHPRSWRRGQTLGVERALAARAFGADYVAHLLRQITTPRPVQPPLQLRDSELNELSTDPLSLLDYDALILDARKEASDDPGRETAPTHPDHHGAKCRDDHQPGRDSESYSNARSS